MNSLEIVNISKSFSNVNVLNDICLEIRRGELFFLLGPSGCGKTTLLRIIAGFTSPDNGAISFNGSDLLAMPVEKRSIGMVFQNYSLWPHMTVLENVAYGLKTRKKPGDIKASAMSAIEMVDMKGFETRKPGALSGGQQQRVALARAIVYEPDILLLDEPLSNLDAKLRKDMRAGIRDLHSRLGITMVYVTHDQEEAASMANRIALMQNGIVIQTDSPQELYRRPKTNFAAEFFGRANIISGTLTDLSADKATLVFKETAITVSTDKEKAVETGSPASVVIRPENIRISTIRPEQGNVLSGTVVSHEFNGASINSIIDVNGLHISVMSFSSETLPDKSSRVYISFNAQDAHCIPQTGAEN